MSSNKLSCLLFICLTFYIFAKEDEGDKKLEGTIISSDDSDLLENAFNDNYTSEFVSEQPSNGWIGLELKSEYRITKIGWAQSGEDKNDYLLGIFEGANNETFIDAIPLYMIVKEGKIGKMNYIDIDVTKTFKYIRYVGPNNKYSVISGFEVYGHEVEEGKEEEEKLYQPTELPLLVIHTENSTDPYDRDHLMISNILTIVDGKVDANKSGSIKLRGNSTYKLEKKSYRLKFDKKTRIFGLPAKAKKWNLLATHMDKTMTRNVMAFHISELMGMRYTAGYKMIDLMINGEYKGTYTLCDVMEVGKKRIAIKKMKATDIEEPEISGGYLLEADGTAGRESNAGPKGEKSGKGITYRIRYPDIEDITEEQKAYIKEKFDAVEAEVYDGIVDHIDIESFLQFFLTEELCGDEDSLWANVYITKDREDDIFRFGPVWDFDLSQDNDRRLYPTNDRDNFVYKYGPSAGSIKTFVSHILSNDKVLPLLKEKWAKITSTTITKESLLDFIDEHIQYINESQKLNYIRWPTALSTKIVYNAQALGTFEAEVGTLKAFFEKRFDVLDDIIDRANATTIEQSANRGGWGGWGDWGGNFPGNWGGRRNNTNINSTKTNNTNTTKKSG